MDTESVTSDDSGIQPVKPGFFNLEISIFSGTGQDNIHRIISFLDTRHTEEHAIVHTAIENLLCVCMCQDRNRRLEAAKRLSAHNAAHPENLNTLANLGYLFREAHRYSDSEACKEKVAELMERRGRKYEILRAQCCLEQAYVYTVMHNEQTGYEIVNDGMNRIIRRLTDLAKCCDRQETKQLVQSTESQMFVASRDLLILEADIHRKAFDKDTCLYLYEVGLEMLAKQPGTELDIQIWCFYQAVLNYCLSDLSTASSKEGDSGGYRNTAAHQFLRVFKTLDPSLEELKLYRARCLGYLGHLLSISFEGKGDVYKDTLETFKITVSQQGGVSLYLFDKSKMFCPEDFIVLSIEARFYMYKALHKISDIKEQKRMLDRANIAVVKSLNAHDNKHENFLAYSLRRDINYNLFRLSGGQKEGYLREAKEAGQACVSSGGVADLILLGRICFNLGICQPASRRLSVIVDRDEVLYEGIDYLQQAMEIGVQGEMKVDCYAILARSLFELKQYRFALECIKRVMECQMITDITNRYSLELLITYFLQFYRESRDKQTTSPLILHEFVFWLSYALVDNNDPSFFTTLGKYMKDYSWELTELSEVLIEKVNGGNGQLKYRDFLQNLIQKLDKIKNNESKRKQPSTPFSALRGLKNRNCVEKKKAEAKPGLSNLLKNVLKMTVLIPANPHGTDVFDFVVCNHHDDNDWVMYVLRPALEESFGCKHYTGYLVGREVIAGGQYMEHIKERVADKIILLLSDSFLEDEWYRIEQDTELLHILTYKSSDGCLLPVMLSESLNIPKGLRTILEDSRLRMIGRSEWHVLRKYLL